MNDSDDFCTVVGRFVDRDIPPLDNYSRNQFRAGAAHFRMLREKLELFKQPVEQLVGGSLVLDSNMAPDISHLALGAR